MEKPKKDNNTGKRKKKINTREETMQKIKEMGLEDLVTEIAEMEPQAAMKYITEMLLNLFMLKERDFFLKSDDSEENKANGFYPRNLACMLGNLSLKIPRDRSGQFRPQVLPKEWQRYDKDFQDLLLNLILQSYSPSRIRSLLNSLNLPYSMKEIEELKDSLYAKAKELKMKELPSECFALFIDAYHTEIKDEEVKRVRKAVIYSIIGMDMNLRKDFFGYYVFFGSEKKGDWLKIFNDLIARGLKRVLLITSDDFPGVSDAIKTLFPQTDHQLCFIHMQRNIFRNMSKEDASRFNEEINRIKLISNYEEAVNAFETLCSQFESKYSSYIKMLKTNKERYLSYKKYPEAIRKHIYTTNIVENINSKLEGLRVNHGGYFQSVKTAEISIYVIVNRIIQGRWRKPLTVSKEVLYEIRQIFNSRFTE